MAFNLAMLASPLAPKSNRGDFDFTKVIGDIGNRNDRLEQNKITNERNRVNDERQGRLSDAQIRAANATVREKRKEEQLKSWGGFVAGLTSLADDIPGTENAFKERISSLDKQINEQLKTNPDLPSDLRITKDHTLGLYKQFKENPEAYGRSLAAEDSIMTRMKVLQEADDAEFKTDAGQYVADRELMISQYGDNSPQLQAFDEAMRSDAAGDGPSLRRQRLARRAELEDRARRARTLEFTTDGPEIECVGEQVVRRASAGLPIVGAALSVDSDVDERRARQRTPRPSVAARVREQRTVELREQVEVAGAHRANRADHVGAL